MDPQPSRVRASIRLEDISASTESYSNARRANRKKMTQQVQREAIVIVIAVVVFARAAFPRPIIERATKKPYRNQLIARLCYVGIGLFCILVWYGIYSEGKHLH